MECFGTALRSEAVDLSLSNVVVIGKAGDLIVARIDIVLIKVYLFLCKWSSPCIFAKSKCVPTRQFALINRVVCLKSADFAVVDVNLIAQRIDLIASLQPMRKAIIRSGKFADADALQRRRKVAFFNAIGAAAVGG